MRTFPTLAPKSDFLPKKLLLSEKVTFELPGLENGSIVHLFLKGWEPSARTATFDDEGTTFAEDLTKTISKFSKKPLSGNAKTRPDFRAAQSDCV